MVSRANGILFYNEIVIDHFMNPRNVGELSEQKYSGFTVVGDPECGDQMKLWILVRDQCIQKNLFQVVPVPRSDSHKQHAHRIG
jgi:NifU-like protein involved in Fe-S cluster formation